MAAVELPAVSDEALSSICDDEAETVSDGADGVKDDYVAIEKGPQRAVA
jgi:hypothetical protein